MKRQWLTTRDTELHPENRSLQALGLNLRERSPIVAIGVILRRMSA